mmetsp:Transcript_14811/g.22627  ORF Transcript_14811/g.22627 Transcript_14811/m.22627 type:complete len:605 (+) Transcript_14811:77-1891(+)
MMSQKDHLFEKGDDFVVDELSSSSSSHQPINRHHNAASVTTLDATFQAAAAACNSNDATAPNKGDDDVEAQMITNDKNRGATATRRDANNKKGEDVNINIKASLQVKTRLELIPDTEQQLRNAIAHRNGEQKRKYKRAASNECDDDLQFANSVDIENTTNNVTHSYTGREREPRKIQKLEKENAKQHQLELVPDTRPQPETVVQGVVKDGKEHKKDSDSKQEDAVYEGSCLALERTVLQREQNMPSQPGAIRVSPSGFMQQEERNNDDESEGTIDQTESQNNDSCRCTLEGNSSGTTTMPDSSSELVEAELVPNIQTQIELAVEMRLARAPMATSVKSQQIATRKQVWCGVAFLVFLAALTTVLFLFLNPNDKKQHSISVAGAVTSSREPSQNPSFSPAFVGNTLQYGDIVTIRQNTLSSSNWLTGARNIGNWGVYVRDVSSAPERAQTTYEWIVRSQPGTGKRTFTEDKRDCVKNGDTIYLQSNHMDFLWLTGGRDGTNTGVYTRNRLDKGREQNSVSTTYEWKIQTTVSNSLSPNATIAREEEEEVCIEYGQLVSLLNCFTENLWLATAAEGEIVHTKFLNPTTTSNNDSLLKLLWFLEPVQ